ncbi:DUF4153 domain-containing protein [Mesonia aestuariivivens]|uniref:DUF4153 domain-containing protein n=1 Tax=Mesonia aestuariivivens TaxID=2796128 RepID=A0ABS6W1N2_9FLAO|nr:DUF4153 domain-containing protein [Mesonia aestuariivivens]MBW2961654.1 DUF4153 domain-containing protein [Mesonia aestuariivivens]
MSYFKELPSKMNLAFKRFPITLLWAVAGSLLIIALIQLEVNIFRSAYKEMLILSLGVSWLIASQFLKESIYNKKTGWTIKLVIILLLITYYFTLPSYDNANVITFTRWFILLLAGHIFIFFAPFIFYWNIVDYWNYLQRIIIAIARSILFTTIIYLGLSLALLAVENLFSIDIEWKVYTELFVFCIGIINTFIYLSDFPKDIHHTKELHYSKALDVLIKYILIPIIILYLVIVYAYSLKILFIWELPKGWVSYLISILSIVGFIIHIIIEPIRKQHKNLIINKFYPVLYFSLFPLFILLFIAIFTRIEAYNFTENRYFLLLLAIWVLGVSLFALISKEKKLSVLPISLFLLCLFSIFGPWSAFQVSLNAQANEVSTLIQKTKNGKQQLSVEEVSRFTSIASYLKQREKLHLIDKNIGFETSYINNSFDAGNYLLDSIYGRGNYKKGSHSSYYHNNFYYHNYDKGSEINISGYDKFLDISSKTYTKSKSKSKYELNINHHDIILRFEGNELFKKNIGDDIKKKLKKYQSLNNIPKDNFKYEITNDIGKFKVIIISLGGTNKNNKVKIENISVYVIIAYKKI